MNWLKKKIKSWLGITCCEIDLSSQKQLIDILSSKVRKLDTRTSDLVKIGVDVEFHGQTTIVVMSKLKGGQFRIIETEFSNVKELIDFVRNLQERYSINRPFVDAPYNMKHFF